MIELIKRPVFTPKAVQLTGLKKFTFDVDVKLTKPQIKQLMKDFFKVDALSVNTHRPPRKKRRLGLSQGYKASTKRVIITLAENKFPAFLFDEENVNKEKEKDN